MPFVLKRKIKNFFSPKDKLTINTAVHDVTTIITEASILVKYYYLQWFDHKKHNDPLLHIDYDLFNMAILVIQNKKYYSRNGEKAQEKKYHYEKLYELASQIYSVEKQDKNKNKYTEYIGFPSSLTNLTFIFNYSIRNLLTAYENNIITHFPSYPKKHIRCDLIKQGFPLYLAKRLSWKLSNYFMYDTINEEIQDDMIEKFTFLYPPKSEETCRAYDLKKNPMKYLYYMVKINRRLELFFPDIEEKYKKLYSPLPFHSSFIPMHIKLDTSGLIQLLFDRERIEGFQTYYDIQYGVKPYIEDKIHMLSKKEKIFPGRIMNEKDEHEYVTSIWLYLTNLGTTPQYKEIEKLSQKRGIAYCFDNTILTDGTTICIQVTEEEHKKRNNTKGKRGQFRKPKKKKESQEKCIQDDNLDKKVLGCDLGKKNIACITDGVRKCNYTKRCRNYDTRKQSREKKTNQLRDESGIRKLECDWLSETRKKTCHPLLFLEYAKRRNDIRHKATQTYDHPHFRQSKYFVYCKNKSSEMRYIKRVHKKFDKPCDVVKYKRYTKCMTRETKRNAKKNGNNRSNIVIAIGTGGSGMNNLKGTESSPFKHIQKVISQFYNVEGQEEMYTSKTCPCCKERALYKRRCVNKENKVYDKNGLLCCENTNCRSRIWNRDLVGGYNILGKFLYRRRHQLRS